MARAEYLTEKNFSSGSSPASGNASGEGAAFGAAASSGASWAVVVSGFLVKNSIFLFNAAKKRVCKYFVLKVRAAGIHEAVGQDQSLGFKAIPKPRPD